MKLRFFGHAAVGLNGRGPAVLMDPYEPQAFNGRLKYSPIPDRWEVVVVSHEHLDHNYIAPSFGTPHVVRGPGTFSGLDFQALVTPHGDAGGTVDFETRMTRFVMEDMVFVHPGDVGVVPAPETCAVLRPVDLLFLPVGGHFTVGPQDARRVLNALAPRVVVPIHYKTAYADLAIGPLEDFLAVAGTVPVRRFSTGEVEISAGTLPARTEIWVLPPLCTGGKEAI